MNKYAQYIPKKIRDFIYPVTKQEFQVRVCVSGGFDPITIGHIRYIHSAARLGDKLIVILNNDKFLMNKKRYVFMPFEERKEILQAIKGVDEVFDCIDLDHSVCKTLGVIRPNIFAKGGADRGPGNVPEEQICKELGIKLMYGVGGSDKPQSSSWLIYNVVKKIRDNPDLRRKYDLS